LFEGGSGANLTAVSNAELAHEVVEVTDRPANTQPPSLEVALSTDQYFGTTAAYRPLVTDTALPQLTPTHTPV